MSNLETEQKPSWRLWILAAVGALVLHIGCGALAVAHLQTEEADDSLGAAAIEVGLELASLHREATDLPPGPDADASVASPALSEQKAEVKETELPKDVPTETDDPDRVVAPNESKKPKDDDPKIAAVQTSASTESVAAEATATPSSDAIPEGPRSISPAQGPAAGGTAAAVSGFDLPPDADVFVGALQATDGMPITEAQVPITTPAGSGARRLVSSSTNTATFERSRSASKGLST